MENIKIFEKKISIFFFIRKHLSYPNSALKIYIPNTNPYMPVGTRTSPRKK